MRNKSRFSVFELIVGLLLVTLGVFTFVRPDGMLTGIVAIYGAIAVVTGIDDIVFYVRLSKFTGFGPMLSLISGIMSVMCGIMLLANPDIGKIALTFLFPIWFIAHCISGLAHANFIRFTESRFYYCFTLTMNIIGLILGFVMLFSPAFSFMSIRTVQYMIAAYLAVFGVYAVISSFMGRRQR